MSENKYIIDKDSLTGIADAVRDKLGTGEATTDSQTGDIVYPEDKGYYLKEEMVAKISGFGWSQTGYSGNFTQGYAPYIKGEDWTAAVGEPWYSVEITLVNVSGNDLYDMDVYYSGGSQSFTNVRSSTYTVSVPNGSTYFQLYFGNSYSSSRWNGSSSLGSLTAIFKDAEGKPIKPKQSSYHYLWTLGREERTANFETENVPTPIPFSIDDIQDRITNYLSKGGSSFEYPIPTQTLSSGSGAWYLNLESTFSSVEDFKNRFLQASVNMGTNYQAFYLVCGKDGKPASMKELGITLRNDIYSNLGSWDMNDVRTSYENNLTFPLVWLSYPVDKNTFWLYVTSDAKNMVFCAHGLVGYQLSNSGYLYVAYKEA